jgi:hypothetical protein
MPKDNKKNHKKGKGKGKGESKNVKPSLLILTITWLTS